MLDMARVHEAFEASTDFTVGIEEEFAILDPHTLSLDHRFQELKQAADSDPVLAESVAGELIKSEIEIRSGKGETFADAIERQREARVRLFRLAAERGALLAATGTHPWSPWQDQQIIETEHYRRVAEGLRYVAWRNNTFSLHVHVGVRGANRAVRVCDRLRPVLPELLALSANSPFLDGRNSGLHSARSQIFTKSFPRCGIPDSFGGWPGYADYVDFLIATNSIVEQTQIWWSVRPHHSFGTVELRICDAQTSAADSTNLEALITACVAQAALDEDEGVPHEDHPHRFVEENFWRAIRYGLDGKLIDLSRREEYPAAAVGERLLEWTAPARGLLGIDPAPVEENGAQRQRRALAQGASMEQVFAAEVEETQRTYAAEEVSA
jgi:glutamate---cysteine ligase / carboxylate-amine ligase